jgi:hypothetical protein
MTKQYIDNVIHVAQVNEIPELVAHAIAKYEETQP